MEVSQRMGPEPQRNRGGRPKGSKNKKKAVGRELIKGKYETAQERIAANLPSLIDVMIERAVVDGDVSCAKYLIDRILGKATERQEIVGDNKVTIEIQDDWRQ